LNLPSGKLPNGKLLIGKLALFIDGAGKYILNQPEHHRKVTFAEEYDEFISPEARPENSGAIKEVPIKIIKLH